MRKGLLRGRMRDPRRAGAQQDSGATRRRFLAAVAGLAPTWQSGALAYPDRAVRLVVGFAPGGASDLVSRLMAQRLSDTLGQPFVVENKPGAGTNIAAELVARAPANGETLLLASVANTVNASLYGSLRFDFIRDFLPVAGLVRGPLLLETHPSLPIRSVAEFIAYAKANPGKIAMASAGNGSPGHMAIELLKRVADIDVLHVPFNGAAPAVTATLAGQAQAVFDNLATSVSYMKDGSLRALGVTSPERFDLFPGVPSLAETAAGYSVESWFGLVAPKGMPEIAMTTLNRAINEALRDPAWKERWDTLGVRPFITTPTEFGAFVSSETDKWAKVVRASGLRLE